MLSHRQAEVNIGIFTAKEWTLNGVPVLPDEHIKLTNEDYNTKLKIVNAKRADSGTYTLTAKNKNGSDSATVTVTVLDIPLPPEGPLNVADVTKSGCTVSWKPPKGVVSLYLLIMNFNIPYM